MEKPKLSDYTTRLSVSGERALVTGASKGLGAEIASVLADADLALVARDRAGLDATREANTSKGRRCIVIEADLATPSSKLHPNSGTKHKPSISALRFSSPKPSRRV